LDLRKDNGVQITKQDNAAGRREPTVSRDTSLGQEFFRSAEWQDGDVTTRVTAIAFVSGLRAHKNPDGSIDLLDTLTRVHTLNRDEYLQPIERAVFMWERQRPGTDGTTVFESEIDYSNEVGLYYVSTIEEAEEQCRIFIENLDFGVQFDPAAWK
jgi:hypothetical protein